MYDLTIIGAGPAGLAAAVMGAHDGLYVLLLERADQIGGRAGCAALVENIVPFGKGFTGEIYRQECMEQLIKFEVDVKLGSTVTSLSGRKGNFTVACQDGNIYKSRTVLITIGLSPKYPLFPIDEGCIVSYTPDLFRDNIVGSLITVIGSGNAAGQAALHYYREGAYVTLILRDKLSNSMSNHLVKLIINSRIDLLMGTVTGLFYRMGTTYIGMAEHDMALPSHKVHLFLGGSPEVVWLDDFITLDSRGYIEVNKDMMTSVSGVFGAGDIVSGVVPGIQSAQGYGAMAANSVLQWLVQTGLKSLTL